MAKKEPKKKEKFQFSKLIILFETTMVCYVSYKVLEFAEMCIINNYMGSLAFLTTMITVVWAAYGTSVSFYYDKSKKENVPKIQGAIEQEKFIMEQEVNNKESQRIPLVSSDIDCDHLL